MQVLAPAAMQAKPCGGDGGRAACRALGRFAAPQKLACTPTLKLRPGRGTRPGAVWVSKELAL